MSAGRFSDAARIYAELVKALPDNPGLLMNLGMAQHMGGDYRRSIAQFRAAVRLEPGLFPAWLFLGVSHLQLGEPDKAIEPLEKALQIQPDYVEARQSLADALIAIGRFEPAAVQLEKLAQLDARNPKVWYGLGRCYDALSRQAFADLEKVGRGSGYWLAVVGGLRLVQQHYSAAFYFYREALAKQPNLRGLHGALADVYGRTGHADWAAIEQTKERRLPPLNCAANRVECDFVQQRYRQVVAATASASSADAYYWRSLAYNELALGAFHRLAQLPDSAEIHELKAGAHRNQGRHVEAVKEWREALKLAPGNPQIQHELAISLHQTRDYAGAMTLLQELLKKDPDAPDVNYYLGDSLLNQQQGEKAIPFLKKAAERDPALLPAQGSLARAYLQVGQSDRAIPHLKAALPLDEDGSLHYQLARAYQGAGQADLAKQTLAEYQKVQQAAQQERQKLEQEARIVAPE